MYIPIFVYIAFLLGLSTAATDGSKLLMVVETFRHGARNRLSSSYPYTAAEAVNFGELTGVGQRMHYVFG